MAANEVDEFHDWLISKLESLEIDAEVYAAYVEGIIGDKDTPLNDRCTSIVDILSAVSEKDLTAFEGELAERWEENENRSNELKLLDEDEKQKNVQLEYENDRELAKVAVIKKKALEEEKRNRPQHDLENRERLLNQYGFESITEYDENGNLVLASEKCTDSSSMGDIAERNTNRARVEQHHQQLRMKAKQDREKEVQQQKEALAKDKLKKEAAKRKTVKREKQRGCG